MGLSGKKILVGITGGIAAYKTLDLIRKLIKLGAEVVAVITPSAKEFVTETTLRTLTRNQVYSEQFTVENWKPEHISLADNADLMLICPATANTIGKMANGICDNLLTSLIMAFKKDIIVAPAMNCNMWQNHFLQENLSRLEKSGIVFVQPSSGELACGYEGEGRLADIDTILNKVCETLSVKQFLKDKKILITAGGTKEPIDPVRFIGNKSSGKMGIAIADAASEYGAEVVLISTVKTQKKYKVISVETAEQMLAQVKENFGGCDGLIMAAAVADFRVANSSEQKIKKGNSDKLTLELVKNPDILKEISVLKSKNQKIIGFCAESENLLQNAEKKLSEKKLDFIVANDISDPRIGFNSYDNAVTIIDNALNKTEIGITPKKELAKLILQKVFRDEYTKNC